MRNSFTRTGLAALLAATVMQAPAWAADVRVLMAIDPASDESSQILLGAAVAPAQSLGRALGQRATIYQTHVMAEALRASRTVENEIIIAPAHVTASAVLHAYQLLATSGKDQVYALVVRNGIDDPKKMVGRRIYLPQQDSLRTYLAKGLLTESGIKLTQFSKVTYGQTTGAGLYSLLYDQADVTLAEEKQARIWIAEHPGQFSILKTTQPFQSGMSVVVRKDYCATECPRLLAWVNSPEGAIQGVGKFTPASADSSKQLTYVASLGITTPPLLKGVTVIGADQIAALVAQKATIVDTRSQQEYDNQHIPGAVVVSYLEKSLKETDFDAKKDDFTAWDKLALPKDRPVVLLCNGPECWKSYKAARAALDAGYTKIYWFRGGMPEWREKNMPMEGSSVAAAGTGPATARKRVNS